MSDSSVLLQVNLYIMHCNATLLDSMLAWKLLWDAIPSSAISTVALVMCLMLAWALWLSTGKRPIYLCDFYCFHPPEHLGGDVETFVKGMRRSKRWTEQSLDFMDKVSNLSGLGNQTYFPAGLLVARRICSQRRGLSCCVCGHLLNGSI